MKKKILNVLLIFTLFISLVLLTACGETKENDEKKTSKNATDGKEIIKEFEKCIEEKDEKKITKLFNLKDIEKFLSEEYDEDDVEAGFKYVFENDMLEYKINKITKVESKEDMEEILDTEISDEDSSEFQEHLKNYSIYYVNVDVNGQETQDMFAIDEDDGEYSIIYCGILEFCLNASYLNDMNSNISKQEIAIFNADFELYEGTQRGSNVKVLVQNVITNNSSNESHIIEINYNDSIAKDITELKNISNNISSTKSYSVEFEKDKDGYINEIIIEEE